jgi:hypothetical protein
MHDDSEQSDLPTFADQVTASLRAGGVAGNIAYDRASERLINETLPESFYLVEPWRVWRRLEEPERAAWLDRYVEVFLRGRQLPRTWEEAREGILPRVRPRVVHVCWPLRRELDGLRVPRLPFGELTEHLVVELAWPQEDAVSTVLMEDLERWGVTPDAALEAAASVLRTRSEKPAPWLGSTELPGVWRSPWQDRFDASRILFGGGLGLDLEGPPVAVAPDDGCLLVAGAEDEEGLLNLGRAARREIDRRGSFLWLRPLRLGEQTWAHWLPPPAHGAFASLKLLHAVNERDDYERHGELLQRWIDREGGDTLVSPVHTLQDPLGNTFTAAEWRAERPVALARADAVLFRRGGEELALAGFARVLEVLGDLLQERPEYPTRYVARSFPEDWQLEQLRGTGD